MVEIDWENYEDEYEYLYDQPQGHKITKMKNGREDGKKKKEKKSRRISKQEMYDDFSEEDNEDFTQNLFLEIKKENERQEPSRPTNFKNKNEPEHNEEKKPPRDFSGANVHTIKNVQINFDGVADMQKIQNTYNNKDTYGIKFLFKSKNNTFRIIWFNQNIRERDSVYNTEFAFWKKIESQKNN